MAETKLCPLPDWFEGMTWLPLRKWSNWMLDSLIGCPSTLKNLPSALREGIVDEAIGRGFIKPEEAKKLKKEIGELGETPEV
jgi:hypothetical protein